MTNTQTNIWKRMYEIAKDRLNELAMVLVLVVLVIAFSFATENFFSQRNLINVFRQVTMIGITAFGLTFVLITGGVDLSTGSMLALTGVTVTMLMVNLGIPPWLAIILALLLSALMGLINGLATVYLHIHSLVSTLATMQIYSGIAFILTRGQTIFGFPESFDVIGKGYIGAIPIPVVIMITIMLIGWIVLNKTKLGRYTYAVGGNKEAAKLSGISVNRIIIVAMVICGLSSGIAGIIMASRVGLGQANISASFGFEVITAVMLGGGSIDGGEGKVSGVLIGVLIMGVLSNGLVMLNVYEYYQLVIKGLVLLVAVGFDKIRQAYNFNRAKARV
jgi:ribose transport system permease protein